MPVALPTPDEVLLTRPDADEVAVTARGIASAVAPATGLTPLQRVLLEAIFPAMTDHPVNLGDFQPMTAHELADRVAEFAAELCVDEKMVDVAREFAAGSFGLAAVDFERNGYTGEWHPDDVAELHTTSSLQAAWDIDSDDPDLAAQWAGLEELAPDTLGRQVWQMYRARGFTFPGLPGSAPVLLAQHDWVHVLAGFGTTVESELEVFGFIARANDDMHAFSLLAMVVSLFETGYLSKGAGLFEASVGHLSSNSGVAVRLADAMRRGAWCHDEVTGSDSIDFLRLDWFAIAHLSVDEARRRFAVRPKSQAAIDAGSVDLWSLGGISLFQLASGQRLADELGVPYESYGAAVA